MLRCKAKALEHTEKFKHELNSFAKPRLSTGCAFRYTMRYTHEEDGSTASGHKANIQSLGKLQTFSTSLQTN